MTRRAAGVALFALEDTTAQIVWAAMPAGPVTVRCGDVTQTAIADGGPGSVVVRDLEPDTAHTAVVSPEGEAPIALRFRTLAPPPGAELCRFATISDLHVGRPHFGFTHKIREGDVDVPHPLRCGRAAIDELLAWGATRLVVKGDLVDSGQPTQWDDAAELLSHVAVPVDVIPGNHDASHPKGVDPFPQAERVGLRLHRGIHGIDLDGLRIVLMDSTVPGVDRGRWNHLRDEAVESVGSAPGPAMLVVHHHPMPFPVPTFPPRGIPSVVARPFIRALSRANPALVGTSGHTHRYRRRDICGVPWTEVGSPKDYPGGWAGYVVHEGGIRQVVRRIERRDCLDWLELTKGAAKGAWGVWSPGTIEDRCFSYAWPEP